MQHLQATATPAHTLHTCEVSFTWPIGGATNKKTLVCSHVLDKNTTQHKNRHIQGNDWTRIADIRACTLRVQYISHTQHYEGLTKAKSAAERSNFSSWRLHQPRCHRWHDDRCLTHSIKVSPIPRTYSRRPAYTTVIGISGSMYEPIWNLQGHASSTNLAIHSNQHQPVKLKQDPS